ncbi:hypothetical protein CSUI_006474 [Cystoisospora suis]|uniref:Uncharacterized protein n=1 Tax=Cystoisospora suis TaxID=483139 RepID=A0A2C6KTT9_9APIC|nr:hypothetical protein CSUI_006474 [Cystoisospora suis]
MRAAPRALAALQARYGGYKKGAVSTTEHLCERSRRWTAAKSG